MSTTESTTNQSSTASRRKLMPMDPQVTDIQPGGGIVIHLEQTWGTLRRWYLKTFRQSYLKRMEACRRGDRNPAPHDVLDPRDMKFFQNQVGAYFWNDEDDPFTYRNTLPFVRVGLAELLVIGGGLLLVSVAAAVVALISDTMTIRIVGWTACGVFAILAGLVAWFFRNPKRQIPTDPGLVVCPADGTITGVEEVDHDEFVGGPAICISMFLSIVNVHINRSPIAGRVIGIRYQPGKYLNAMRPESSRENEQLAVLLEESAAPHRGMIVRQITGAIARRIVCCVGPGHELERGEPFGMIKLGSRTELVLPKEESLTIRVKKGTKVRAGSTVLASYNPQ